MATTAHADYSPSQVGATYTGDYYLCSLAGATVVQTPNASLAAPPAGFYANPTSYCYDEADWFINVGGNQDDTSRSRWIQYAGVAPAPVVATRSGGYVYADADTFFIQPACVANQGAACSSAANSCSMTNAGTVQCDGSCSAVTPSNSLCPTALPDLTSTAAPVGSTATVGTPMTFTGGVIKNIGTATATSFPNILQFVNQAGTVQTGIVAASPSSMTLAVNASASATGTYTFPSGGTYYARFCANYNTTPTNVITESNYGNNCGPISGAITVSGPAAPDITAAKGATVTDPINTPIILTSLVSNIGTGAASSNFHNIVEVCNKVDCSGSISVTLAGNDIASLAVNASKSVSASYTPTTLGTLYYQICGNLNTGWANTISESNTGNNCGGWATLTVGTPITASCSVSPTTVQAGSPVTWTASASGGSGSLTYTWGGSVTGTGTSVQQTYNTAGTYSGTITVTDAGSDTSGPVTCTSGGGGSPGGGANTTVYSCIPALSAAPSTVNAGSQSTLTWSENTLCASSCLFSDGHPAGLSGTYQVTPPTPPSGNTDTYSVTCGVPANTNQTIITVNVATATISANPNRVASGGTTALTWSASPSILTACTITRNGVDMGVTFDKLSGTSVSDPTHITTQTVYKLSCTGPQNATASATAIVNVLPAFTEF